VIEATLRGGPSLDAVPVSRKVTGWGPVIGQKVRLFQCKRCAREVCICAACDHGQVACPECRVLRRRESMGCAGAKYQGTHRGACKHALRQGKWRAKSSAKKVTHHGFPSAAPSAMVIASSATVTSRSSRSAGARTGADDAITMALGAALGNP
jgi:hypothetical protein